MSYRVKITDFEGPLDLLLHLIQKEELDICELSLALIADQYLDYVQHARELNLEIETSYIVIFAELLEIKSRVLLPTPLPASVDEEDVPESDLVERLREYKRLKEGANQLELLHRYSSICYPRSRFVNPYGDRMVLSVTPSDLVTAFEEVMERRAESKKIVTIRRPAILMADKIDDIWRIVLKERFLEFAMIASTCSTRAELVASFVALLELARRRKLRLLQKNWKDNLKIECLSGKSNKKKKKIKND
ncbi:MAG: segregation/condensation protein A [Candidatus Eremiobacteraeota bacterium]|nr:segregation/condensation protein A [Candidatus Eremiobacteraeota bacterium]